MKTFKSYWILAASIMAAMPTMTMSGTTDVGEPIISHTYINWNNKEEVIPEMYTIYYPIYDEYVDYYCPEALYFDCNTNSCRLIKDCCMHSKEAVGYHP